MSTENNSHPSEDAALKASTADSSENAVPSSEKANSKPEDDKSEKLLEQAEDLEDDEPDKALELVEEAIKLNPQNGRAWCMKADLLQDMDKPGEAFQVLCKACDDMPQNTDCLFAMGAFLSEHGNSAQSAEMFFRVNQIDPKYPRIKIHLGNAFLKIGQWKPAIDILTEALDTDLGDIDKARVLNHIGEAHMNNIDPSDAEASKKELETAQKFFDKSLELNDEDYIPVGNMAMSFCRLQEPDSALKVLEPVLQKHPEQAKLHIIHAIALSFKDDDKSQKEALAAYDKAIELDPESADFFFHKAHYYIRRKEMDEACATFEEGIKIHPDSGELCLQYGSLLRMLNKPEKSIQYHRRGLKLLGRLIHWGFCFIDEDGKPVDGTNIAIESDRIIPKEKVAEQYFEQLKMQGHKIDDKGIVDGKYRVGMSEIPEDRVVYEDNPKEL